VEDIGLVLGLGKLPDLVPTVTTDDVDPGRLYLGSLESQVNAAASWAGLVHQDILI
jgi:hypothetical protein